MSVLKSILHHWNSTSKAYDTLHPETEAAQVTDWHESIIGSLASKVLPTVVSELTTDSVMGKLMKMLLNASGVKYSIDTNGYVCLGSFFGGLIIQWIQSRAVPNEQTDITLPMTMSGSYIALAGDKGDACISLGAHPINQSTVRVWHLASAGTMGYCHILVLGRQ